MNKALIFCLVVFVFAGGCAKSQYSKIQIEHDSFTGQKVYKMNPGAVNGARGVLVGLRWSEEMGKLVMFDVKLNGQIENIQSQDGLQFNIDGDIVKLSSPETGTDIETWGRGVYADSRSSRRFVGSTDLLERLAISHSVKLRLVTGTGQYAITGNFSHAGEGHAMAGLREFYRKISALPGYPSSGVGD